MSGAERIADILGEWLRRRRRGEPVDPEAVIGEHPDLADELRARFAAMAIADRVFAVDAGMPAAIGEYRILREIGRGGMGVVYEAEQTSMRRRVALKVLFASVTSSPKAVKRFQQEAWAAGRLKHTSIVAVHQLGHEGGAWYCAMELVAGRPLNEVIADMRRAGQRPRESGLARRAVGAASPGIAPNGATGTRAYYARVAEMFSEVAEALQVAHDHGVIHRDVKPANLLLDTEGHLKLVDFGLARLEEGAAAMTVTGEMLGTPLYMSPEQIAGAHGGVDHRTDVYSLGATLYESLALRPPFRGGNVQQLASAILRGGVVSPRRRDRAIPRDLETIVLKAMEPEPGRRYRTAGQMAHDLRAFALGEAIRARRVSPLGRIWLHVRRRPGRAALVAGFMLALVAAGGLWAAVRQEQKRLEAEAARREELQYVVLCVEAEQEAIREAAASASAHGRSETLYVKAIALAPGRFEAFLSRSLVSAHTGDRYLSDVDAAAARGAPPRVIHLARAWHHESHLRAAEAEREYAAAARHEAKDAYALFFEGMLSAVRGDRERALALLDAVVARSPVNSSVGYMSRWHRCLLHEERFDYVRALADAHALEAAGDRGIFLRTRIASLWRRLGREKEAQALFDEIRRSVSTHEERVALCGICQGHEQQPDWQRLAALDAIEAEPGEGGFHWRAASACAALQRFEEGLQHCDRAIEIDPGAHEPYETKALILVNRGDPRRALVAIRKALEIEGRCVAARLLAASALNGLDRFEEALGECRSALELDPRSAEALEVLAVSLLGKGDVDGARDAVDRALSLRPRLADAHRTRARVLLRTRQYDGALESIDLAIQLAPRQASYLVTRGDILLATDPGSALAAYEAAIARGLETAHFSRGIALRMLDRMEDALEAFRRACEADPERATAHSNRGGALNELGLYDEAMEAHRRAVELDPASFAAHYNLACTLRCARRWAEIPEAVDAALAAPRARLFLPTDSDAEEREALADLHEWKGIALRVAGDERGARADLERALELGGRGPDLFFNVALSRYNAGRRDEALSVLERAVVAGTETARIQGLRGALLLMEGRHSEALPVIDRALELEPRDVHSLVNRALALVGLGEEAEAIRAYEDAIILQPEFALAHSNLASLLLTAKDGTLKNPERAVSLARHAVALMPGEASHWSMLGCALCRVEKWQEALDALGEATRLSNGGEANEWLLAAIAHHRLGHTDEARALYEKAARWMDGPPGEVDSALRERIRDDAHLGSLRKEAAEVLGLGSESG